MPFEAALKAGLVSRMSRVTNVLQHVRHSPRPVHPQICRHVHQVSAWRDAARQGVEAIDLMPLTGHWRHELDGWYTTRQGLNRWSWWQSIPRILPTCILRCVFSRAT